ncbi:hypothetical protein [Streptomyces avicenniae]|uniref:hypothetical protein n=1 Tax=Streptomyces avicenniae TaxID=500153 RepID=UPI00069C0027|nr:hypothetical protein [Streptomyces avicenniae]
MTGELALLAEAGAVALVATMATDLWHGTKETVLGLFRRDDPERAASVGDRLEESAALVRRAAAPDDARRALSAVWAEELADLLRRDPACRAPLARLTAEIDAALAGGRGASTLEQNNTAHDSGTVFAVQQGDIHLTRPADDAPPAN